MLHQPENTEKKIGTLGEQHIVSTSSIDAALLRLQRMGQPPLHSYSQCTKEKSATGANSTLNRKSGHLNILRN